MAIDTATNLTFNKLDEYEWLTLLATSLDKMRAEVNGDFLMSKEAAKEISERMREIADKFVDEDNYLLTIKVKDLNSIPTVKYKGETIRNRVQIKYDWRTGSYVQGKHSYKLVFADEVNKGEVITIEEKRETI